MIPAAHRAILLGCLGLAAALLAACREAPPPAVAVPAAAAPAPVAPAATLPAPALTLSDAPAPPTATLTPLPLPTATPSPAPSPTPVGELQLGRRPDDAPIVAHRVGNGALKVVLMGWDGSFPAQALAAFEANPDGIPAGLSLWIVPEIGRLGDDGTLLPRNADSRFTFCPGDNWSRNPIGAPDGSGGAYPFSATQSQALRTFLQDAWLVLFYETVADPVASGSDGQLAWLTPDRCREAATTAALVELMASRGRYVVAPDAKASGDWINYLNGLGVTAVRLTLPADRPADADRLALAAALASLEDVLAAEASTAGGVLNWLDATNHGEWRLAARNLVHPLALTRLADTYYAIDSGRILALDGQGPPRTVLAPGDVIGPTGGAVVLEPLDLATAEDMLLVLDRGGDVYRYDPANTAWAMERPARGIGETSSHYILSLDAAGNERFLLEESYGTISRYVPSSAGSAPAAESAWLIPEGRRVDLATSGGAAYLLQTGEADAVGSLVRFILDGSDVRTDRSFRPNIRIERPRQLAAGAQGVFVLDRAGTRVLQLDPSSGRLLASWQRRDRAPITALWVDPADGRLVLAGPDRLWFVGAPEMDATLPAGEIVAGRLHDDAYLAGLGGWWPPIAGTDLPARDLQLPDAPRHYRLGLHEGVDYYWQLGTQVRAPAAGTVIRSLLNFTPPTPADLARWGAESESRGTTSEEALDGYRGRQVWIQHADGLVTRYAHLRWIAPDIVEGAPVAQGQLLGEVGNSGSPSSLISETEDAHLHFEIWLDDQFLGQFLRPAEIRDWLSRLFVKPPP